MTAIKIIEAEVKDKLMETINDNDDHNKIILTIHKPLMMFMTLKMMKRLKTLNILKRMKRRIYFCNLSPRIHFYTLEDIVDGL